MGRSNVVRINRRADKSKPTLPVDSYQVYKIKQLSNQLGWDVTTFQEWLVEILNKSTIYSLTWEEADWMEEMLQNFLKEDKKNFKEDKTK